MALLLTILSVLALWALLTVLVAGLLLILKPLDGVRTRLEKITMGVRAIEEETKPLGARAETLIVALGHASDTLGATAHHLAEASDNLGRAAPLLHSRSRS